MGRLRGNPWAVLVVVSLGFFMTLLDLTIVNIAIPNIIDRLHASLDDVLWVLNAYALVLAVLVITAGRLGDLFGRKKIFLIGLAVFTAASLVCGLAESQSLLIEMQACRSREFLEFLAPLLRDAFGGKGTGELHEPHDEGFFLPGFFASAYRA